MWHQALGAYAETRSVLPLAPTHASLRRAVASAAFALGFGCALIATSPAAAAVTNTPIETSATDRTGDAKAPAGPEADITGFAVTQDRAARRVRGTVTFAGAATMPGVYKVRIALGRPVDGERCQVDGVAGVVNIRAAYGATAGEYVVTTMTDVRGPVAVSWNGATMTFETSDGPFDGYGYRCVGVGVERITSGEETDVANPVDIVVGFAPPEPELKPDVPVDPGKGVPAPILDADGDGVHDGIDKCPAVPGAAMNGCESMPVAKSFRLGTKRLVVDRLLATTAGTCPKTVKVVAVLGGKTVGRQPLGTMTKGKFCHVQGVVKLKKRVKKARVTISGVGVVSVAATVAK